MQLSVLWEVPAGSFWAGEKDAGGRYLFGKAGVSAMSNQGNLLNVVRCEAFIQ